MRTFKLLQPRIILCLLMTCIMGLLSCCDDEKEAEQSLPPTIVKVCVWDEDIEEWVIPETGSRIRIGTRLRIEGTNMAQTIAVYINGGHIAEFQAEENVIEFVIPDIPVDEGDINEINLNLIRVVNKAGAATCTAEDFEFFGKKITVSAFYLTEDDGRTWTEVEELPIGGKIRIEGGGLRTISGFYVNGESVSLAGISAEEKNDAFLIVTIPETLPFGSAVTSLEDVDKIRLVTAYDDRKLSCTIVGKQAEISKITDMNGNAIVEAGRNTVVAIEGKYFATFQKLLFNNQEITVSTIESNRIVFTVPVDTENFEVGEGSLTVVTAFDENGVSREFTLLGFVPNVTEISYTMPKPGNVIQLTGVNLFEGTRVFFPSAAGEKEGKVQSVSTSVSVLVPEGVGDKAGYIRVVSDGVSAEAKGIVMFYNQGVFLRKFTDEELKQGPVDGSTYAFNKYALYNPDNRPVNDVNPVNPDYFICFRNSSVPMTTNSSSHALYLRFVTRTQIENLLAKGEVDITSETLVKDVAMQVDVYMPRFWTSGMLSWRLNKNSGGLIGEIIASLAPWRVNEPFDFGGEWHTFTYKITDFVLKQADGPETMTLGVWLEKYAKTYTSLLTFVNGNFMYQINQQADPRWTCEDIVDLEINLANIRLVPLALVDFE